MFSKFLLIQEESEIPHVLLDVFVSHKWDEDFIRETIDLLLDPSNANAILASKSFPIHDMTISWYNIKYGVHDHNFLTGE